MNRILALFLVTVLSLTMRAAEKETTVPSHEGVWKPIAAILGGVRLPAPAVKAITLKVSGANYEVTVEGEDHADKGTCAFDTTTTPKRITIKSTEGPNKGKTFLAIYEMKDAVSMRVCYDLSGTDFPKKFAAPKGTQLYLVGYRRQSETPAGSGEAEKREDAAGLTEFDRARLAEGGPAIVKMFIATLRKRFTAEDAGELRKFIDPRYLKKHRLEEGKFPIQTVVTGNIFDNQSSADPETLLITAETEGGAKEAFLFRTTYHGGKVYLLPLKAPDPATGFFEPWILRMKF